MHPKTDTRTASAISFAAAPPNRTAAAVSAMRGVATMSPTGMA